MNLLPVAIAAAGALALLWAVVSLWLGPRLGYIDLPDDPSLKAHRRPAVPLGGVGVFVGVHVSLTITDQFDGGLFAASLLVLVLGLVDDRRTVPPPLRLLIEAAAAVLLLATSPAAAKGGWLYGLVGAVLVVVSINAVNLFDGLDGLVGASGVVAGLGLWWLADLRGSDRMIGLGLAGALAGFLVLNWHPARVFLGDNGSYVVGLFLAYGAISATPAGSFAGLSITAAALGILAFDLAVTVWRRRLHRRPLFEGDRSHLYDQLVDRGFSVPQVAVLAALVEAGFVALMLFLDQGVGGWGGVFGLALAGAVLLGLAWSGGYVRKNPR